MPHAIIFPAVRVVPWPAACKNQVPSEAERAVARQALPAKISNATANRRANRPAACLAQRELRRRKAPAGAKAAAPERSLLWSANAAANRQGESVGFQSLSAGAAFYEREKGSRALFVLGALQDYCGLLDGRMHVRRNFPTLAVSHAGRNGQRQSDNSRLRVAG